MRYCISMILLNIKESRPENIFDFYEAVSPEEAIGKAVINSFGTKPEYPIWCKPTIIEIKEAKIEGKTDNI